LRDKLSGIAGRAALLFTLIVIGGAAFATFALANNLDRNTAVKAAKEVARRDCRETTGCERYFVRKMHRLARHKWLGKLHVISHKNDRRFDCVRQVVVKLDHVNGDLTYATSRRNCKDIGPR
jgi:hypothetical protein